MCFWSQELNTKSLKNRTRKTKNSLVRASFLSRQVLTSSIPIPKMESIWSVIGSTILPLSCTNIAIVTSEWPQMWARAMMIATSSYFRPIKSYLDTGKRYLPIDFGTNPLNLGLRVHHHLSSPITIAWQPDRASSQSLSFEFKTACLMSVWR